MAKDGPLTDAEIDLLIKRLKEQSNDIVRKVEIREFEQRCIAVDVCPKCGSDLVEENNGYYMDKVCKPCSITWSHVFSHTTLYSCPHR